MEPGDNGVVGCLPPIDDGEEWGPGRIISRQCEFIKGLSKTLLLKVKMTLCQRNVNF